MNSILEVDGNNDDTNDNNNNKELVTSGISQSRLDFGFIWLYKKWIILGLRFLANWCKQCLHIFSLAANGTGMLILQYMY